VGEGRYQVEVLAVDDQRRTWRKEWEIHVVRHRAVVASPTILRANTVAPADFVPWDGRLKAAGDGVRVTVLLDVAPINPREATLRAWDRRLLLDPLSSLLRAVPCKSVRLVAFNLDQDREIYRNRQFRGGEEFDALEEAMQELELGTVSYHVLQQQQGWVQMLWNLPNTELRADDPADAVVILGPATRSHGHFVQGSGRNSLHLSLPARTGSGHPEDAYRQKPQPAGGPRARLPNSDGFRTGGIGPNPAGCCKLKFVN